MKVKLMKLNKYLLVGIASLLGLTACKKEPEVEYGGPTPMYGAPTSETCSIPQVDETLSLETATVQEVKKSIKDED
jgi:hypothetical protein